MLSKEKKQDDAPRSNCGPSFWLLLVMAVFLAAGIRQMLHSDEKQVASTISGQISQATQPSQLVWSITKISHQHQAASFGGSYSLAHHLADRIQKLQAEKDSVKREQLIVSFLTGFKTENIPDALEILKYAESAEVAGELEQRLVRRWAEGNPQDVAAWINKLPSGDQRQAALDDLAIVWANGQLADAINWGQSLTDEAERNLTLTAVATEAVRIDPVKALQIAVNLPADSQRDELIRRATMDWASGDAQNAVAWAEQIPDETLRAKVLAGAAVAWARQDPESAAVLVVEELPSGRLQEDAVISIVQRWAQQEPESAAAWVAQFPEGLLRETAIENLIAQWSQSDSAAAQQWLAGHS